MSLLSELFSEQKISLFAVLPMEAVKIRIPRKLSGLPAMKSCIIFAVPYRTGGREDCNLSAYAIPLDYHLYFKNLFSALENELRTAFPSATFAGFSDNSPIDERDAAAKSGLGIIGDNGLLITEQYSSFVFLGEILTDLTPETFGKTVTISEIRECEHCGACAAKCPMRSDAELAGQCLSALTQKKGTLTAKEESIIRRYGSVWGCDLCQNVCPHTVRAMENGTLSTPIPFFQKDRIPLLTKERVLSMTEEEFSHRAFAWRGKTVILRNLDLWENHDDGADR